MPLYRITAPNGKTYQIEGPEGASDADVAQAVMSQYPEAAQAPVKTTVGGHAKELVKGIVPGAIGLLESAATGASALLPDDMEKAAREKIASVAGAAKAPFAAAPGYEEAVSRKMSEAVGSTLPFFGLGPLGLAGRVAAGGLGVAAGAGEARTGAEAKGATGSERALATALGAPVGLLDMLAPEIGPLKSMIATAFARGGVEGATEAAQKVAQNLIAKGVYDPKQDVLAGSGEEGAYGAGAGALASLLLDMALPGRQHGGASAPNRGAAPAQPPAAQAPQLPLVTAPGAQGELFKPEEMGVGKAPQRAVPPEAPAAAPAAPTKQGDLGLDYQREVEQLYLERERLAQQAQTEEVKARIAELTDQIRSFHEMDMAERQVQKQFDAGTAAADAKLAKQFPALANAPELMAQSDEVKARTQGELFSPEEMGGEHVGPQMPSAVEETVPTEPTPVPPYVRKGPYQNKLPLRGGEAVVPFTLQDVIDTGVPLSTTKSWFEQNVVGKTPSEVQQMVDEDPTLIDGKGKRAKALRELLAPQAAPFVEEAPNAPPSPKKSTPAQRSEPRAGEPSVGLSLEPTRAELPESRAGVAGPAAEPAAPVGRGLVSAEQPAEPRAKAERVQPTAVSDITQERAFRNALDQEGEMLFSKLRDLVDRGLASDADILRAQQAVRESSSQQEAGFRLFKLLRQIEGKAPPVPPAPTKAAANPYAQLMQQGEAATEAAPEETPAAPAPAAESPFAAGARYRAGDYRPSELTGELTADAEERAKARAYARSRNAAPQGSGQTLADLEQEVRSLPGKAGAAARRLMSTGKLKLEEGDGSQGGLYDGKRATLYARGIGKGKALAVLLHEVGAHLGMKRMLGQKQYDGVIDRIVHMLSLNDDSQENLIARAAFNRIPESDRARGSEVARDELVAYFVEGMGHAEANGELPARGPLRAMWDGIKVSMLSSINRALGTSFGLSSLTPHQIADIAMASIVRESKTGVDVTAETKQNFAVSTSTESLIDSLGPLDPNKTTGLKSLIPGFRAGQTPVDLPYAVKFRTQAADSAATVEHRLRERFDGAVRDSLGKLNPMGLYRQAQDHAKTLLEFFQVGGLVKDPATGQWVVESKKGVRPPAEVYALIDAWGQKNGYSRERATQIASRILEGVRLDSMRTANQTQGTSFLLHMKDAEIDQLVQEYKADPDLQAMSKLMGEARLAMVDNMVAVGRLTPEQGQQWKDVAGYVPFDRIDDFASGFSKIKKISNKGLAQVGKLPELVGSLNRPVGNVFENYLNTLGWMVGQTMKTDATVQTLRSLEDIGQAKFLGRSTQQKDNTVGMYVKGEMMYWELPSKYDVLAFKDLNPPKAGWLRNLGKFSNVLRTSVTALPPFALKQVTDDVQRAIMTSGVRNPGALLRMSLSNFGGIALAELRGIQHPAVRQFGRLGLTGEYDFEAGKPATSLLKDLGYKKRGKFEGLLHRLEGITRASDLAVRKAIYDQTLKETNDQLLAQTRAREFINFRRRGASDFVGAMVTTIPFFNAYIQGMDVLYRAASGKDSGSSVGRAEARRMFWSRAATVMMLSSLYAMGAGDDEDYQEMDLRTRDGNWILPGNMKLPVPGELGALFKVIPERVVEYMKRQGTPEEQTAWEATQSALRYMFEQYVGRVTPVPQAVKPLLEAWTNYSFFTGRELEGIYQKQQDPSMRRASNTSELAIAIADFARDVIGVDKVSPILVDNALNGYFGSSAGLLVAVTDSLLNPTRVDRPLHKWALVSNYMYDPVGTRRMTEFYETRGEVGRANATLNELMKTDMDKAAAYAEAHSEELALESAVNSTLEQLERTRAYRKYLNSPDAAESMSKAEREDEMQELRKMEVGLTGWLREAKASLRQ